MISYKKKKRNYMYPSKILLHCLINITYFTLPNFISFLFFRLFKIPEYTILTRYVNLYHNLKYNCCSQGKHKPQQ